MPVITMIRTKVRVPPQAEVILGEFVPEVEDYLIRWQVLRLLCEQNLSSADELRQIIDIYEAGDERRRAFKTLDNRQRLLFILDALQQKQGSEDLAFRFF